MKGLRFRGAIKWAAIGFALVVALFSIASFLVLRDKDRIAQIVQEQLNAYLEQPVHVGSVDISLLRKFPYVTIEFDNVWAAPVFKGGYSDTLFSVRKIYVLLNLLDVLKGSYSISRLVLRDGFINAYIAPDGKPNYVIWKQGKESATKHYKVELKDISFENIALTHFSHPTGLKMALDVGQLKLGGEIMQGGANLYVKGAVFINYINKGETRYVNNGKTLLSAHFLKDGDIYKISGGALRINKQHVDADGYINHKTGEVKVSLIAKHIVFNSDDNIFNLDKTLTSYANVKGNVHSTAEISGNYKQKDQLDIEALFSLSGGTLQFKNHKLKYSLPYLKGTYQNSRRNKSDYFRVDSLVLSGNNDHITGSFEIIGFDKPALNLRVRADIQAANINYFTGNKGVEFKKGRIGLIYHANDIQITDEKVWEQFLLQAKNSYVQPVGVDMYAAFADKLFTDIHGELFLNQSLEIKKLACKFLKSDFELSGRVSGLYEFATKRNTWITLHSTSENINFSDILISGDNQSASNNLFPDNIWLNWKLNSKNIDVDGVSYKEAKAEVNYKPGLGSLKLYHAMVFEGSLKGNCALATAGDNKLKLALIAEIEQVNIRQMFEAYKNFGQDFIVAANLKGKVDASLDLKTDLVESFKMDAPSLVANASIKITQGELMGHEPMYRLSRYIKLEELKHIYFSDLTNEVYIYNQIVNIPRMQIRSSALDIEVSGRHGFDDGFEYLLSVYLSDWLARKVPQKDKDESFTFVQRSGAKHFQVPFIISGNTTDYDIKLNKKKATQNFVGSMQREKEAVKTALKNEFRVFGKDSTEVLPAPHTGMKFDFNEEAGTGQKETKQPKTGSDKTNLRFQWDEDD